MPSGWSCQGRVNVYANMSLHGWIILQGRELFSVVEIQGEAAWVTPSADHSVSRIGRMVCVF